VRRIKPLQRSRHASEDEAVWQSEEPMITPLILFGLAAVGGFVLALQRLTGKPTPSLPLALVHGAAAAAGLVALIVHVANGDAVSTAKVALALFLAAAAGGFFLFLGHHLRGKALPVPVVVIHGLIAVTAFVTLLLGALR
jgi:hypothetical protein